MVPSSSQCGTALSAASMAAPSFASSQWSYDVFLSFRGEDTRLSFAAHLYVALQRKGVNTFFDDHKIRRGESISPTLILECRKTLGQLVLPIFYNVDPSDVRKHKRSFGEALDKHEKTFKHDMDKVKPEPMFIREIVIDVLKELSRLSPGDAKRLVEEDSPIQKKEVVPSPHSSTIHIAGYFGINVSEILDSSDDSDSDSD
ncbi:hypothetical protein AAG906_017779 [Vitis piasezkii]